MTNAEIIHHLRSLVKGGRCDAPEMREILLAHCCFYLAQKTALAPIDRLSEITSAVTVKERFKQAKPLFESLRSTPYAVVKGAVLSERIYRSPFVRRSGDLDILLRREDLDFAKQVLLDAGFVQGRIVNGKIEPFTRKELIFQASQSHQTAPFVKATNNKVCPFVNLDLNTSIFWGEYKHPCNMDLVLRETEEANLFEIPFKKLAPEMEFISLCLHHYKDMNSIYLLSKGSLKLCLFSDILYYLKNVELNMDKLASSGAALGANRYLYYCLWYTDAVFDDDCLKPYLRRFESAEGKALLDCFGLEEGERCPWTMDLWERLFSPSFCEQFYSSLTERDIEKIKMNETLM